MYDKKSVLSKLILPILMFLLLLSLSGCGNKPNNNGNPSSGGSASPAPTSPQNTAKPATPSPGVAVTYDNYLKIKLDSTYDDVKSILGDGRKVTDTNPDIFSYIWGGSGGKNVNIQFSKDKVISKTQAMLGKTTSTLTEDQFKQLTKGMTFEQVVSILGPDYQESSLKKAGNGVRRVVMWMKPDSTNITVALQDDKVTDLYNFLK